MQSTSNSNYEINVRSLIDKQYNNPKLFFLNYVHCNFGSTVNSLYQLRYGEH